MDNYFDPKEATTPLQPSTTTNTSPGNSKKVNIGLIIGVVIGAVILIAIPETFRHLSFSFTSKSETAKTFKTVKAFKTASTSEIAKTSETSNLGEIFKTLD
ncbi:hypothetical protein F8M41_011083 [Gigaspora margarita]|uniref:Uncharacterized protein n=1 Tax=Gigaspora margarita TaxID=4874 RepID=A0A8H3X2V0_GIGMA|nr:hypothetical protein F8M41_011083 [Gigaspora margarita]